MRRISILVVLALVLTLGTSLAVSAAETLQVDNSGDCSNTNGDPYCTIQAAIDAASSGDTIEVAAGTYEEDGQIVIDKDLSIVGENRDTIIKPAQDTGSSGDARGWFLVEAGNEFNLSNVTLNGDGKQVYQAIRSLGSGTIDNNIIKNIQYSQYVGYGVVVMGDYSMTISNNTLTSIQRIGVMAFGSGVEDAQIIGNSYTGKGDGDYLDYGVEIGGGANATITDNQISGCRGVASTDGSTSAAILVTDLYGPGTAADVANNTFTDNSYGLAIGYDTDDASVVTATNNIFENNEVQVDVIGAEMDLEDTLANNTFDRAVVVRGSGIKVPTIFSSIQDAIDAAEADDTVDVGAGIYEEHLVVDGSDLDGISLVGAVNTDDSPATVLKLTDLGQGHGIDLLEVDDVTVKNFEIYGARDNRSGIHAEDTDGILIDNVLSYDNTKDGIRVRESIGATIKNCVSRDNDGDGITFYSFGTILNNTVADNTERGIFVNGGSVGDSRTGTLTISGNEVYGNLNGGNIGSLDARVGGIIVYSADHVPAVLSVEIEDNVIYNNTGPGLLLYKVNSEHEDGSSSKPAVPVSSDNLSIVRGNTIYANNTRTSMGFGDGILVYLSHYVTIEDNQIYNNHEAGIRLTNDYKYDVFGPTTHNSILLNNIYGNPYAVLIEGGQNYEVTDTTVKDNELLNQEYGLANNNNGDEIVDATYNWWGHASGPYHETSNSDGLGSRVSDKVLFDPWHEAVGEMRLGIPEEPAWLATCEGDEITVDVLLRATGFNAVQFDLVYNPDMLEVTHVSVGSMWGVDYWLVEEDLSTEGRVQLGISLLEADATLAVSEGQVARVTFKAGTASGTAQLNFDNVLVSTPDGVPIDVELTGDALEVKGCGCVAGTVELQGRFDTDWVTPRWQEALVTLSGGPGGMYTATSDSHGSWEVCEVVEGDYDVLAVKTLYLTAERSTPVAVAADGNAQAGSVKLLGGDVNSLSGDPELGDNVISSGDASVVAATFGLTDGDNDYDDNGDINDDDTVNILDCSILGGNYGKSGPVNW